MVVSKNETLNSEALPRHTDADVLVRVIAVPVKAVRPEASLSILLKGFSAASLLPVVDKKKRLIGIIRDQDVLMMDGQWHAQGISPAASSNQLALRTSDRIPEALAAFEQTDQALIPIVDERGRYTGECASRTQLLRLRHGLLRPARIGGLATPLGVYMTTGQYSAGAGWPGLVATGAMFGIMAQALSWAWLVFYSALVSLWPQLDPIISGQSVFVQESFFLVGMLAMLRITPMSGLHAAEHMTINAIERDLELTEAVVREQPREHARCGTNLMVLGGGLMLVSMSLFDIQGHLSTGGAILYLGVWSALILKYWRPIGLWVQRHFTTRDPSPAELASGLKAGRELLEKFNAAPHANPSFWRKLAGSGILQMLLAFAATMVMTNALLSLLGGV